MPLQKIDVEKLKFSADQKENLSAFVAGFLEDAPVDFEKRYWKSLATLACSHLANMKADAAQKKPYAVEDNLSVDDFEGLLSVGLLLQTIGNSID